METTLASERYAIVDLIGEGGVGAVYRVRDERTGELLAMKIIPRHRGVANLRGEFLSLARITHDHIVRVHDYGLTADGHDFFTMDFVDGPPLREAVSGVESPAFYPVIGGVLRALAFLHERGIVHADIKPPNILIDGSALESAPHKAAHLADFGLAARMTDPRASASRGTFPYAAPEVYAGRLDARSDLYALGVVLYELATGTKPWSADDVAQTLTAQRRGPPIDPRALSNQIPDGLAELILALLDPSPGARPQTADEVLARINDIAGTDFEIGEQRPLVDVGSTLVGRARDVAELDSALAQARAGRGGVVLIAGEQGIGKTRLLAELKLSAQLHGHATYMISLAEGADTAYVGITELVRGVLADSGDQQASSGALAPLFRARSETERLDPEARYALAEAVAEVVLDAAAREPLVILVDDVQSADPGAYDLLAYLARAAGSGRVLLALALHRNIDSRPMLRAITEPLYSRAPAGSDVDVADRVLALVKRLPHGTRIELPPLDGHSTREMVRAAFGEEMARSLGSALHRATGGNPADAAYALQSLVDSGTIARKRGQWSIEREEVSIPIPPTTVAAARARAEALPQASRAALHAAAVLGERFRADVLAEILDDGADVTAALVDAAGARLVGADIGAGWFYFTHREVASALYGATERSERRALHERAAAALQRRMDAGETLAPESLAVHYLAIGDDTLGARWSVRAAQARAADRDHHGAAQWYERARKLLADGSPDAIDIDEHLGDLRAVLGQLDAACADLRRAFDATETSPARHIAIALRLAELMRRRGDGEDALKLLQQMLALARTQRLSREESMCQLMLGQVLMYRADYAAAMEHAVAGHLIARARGDHAAAADLGRLRASVEIYQGDAVGALRDLESSLSDAEASGSELAVAEVRFGIGRASIHTGDYPRAIEAHEQARPIFERAGYVRKMASCINNLGAAYYFQGQWESCRERWEQFRDLCQRLDEQSELVNALNNLGLLYRDLGEFTDALATLDRGADVAAQTGYEHMAAMIHGNRGDVLYRQADLAGARACYEHALTQFKQLGAREDIIENKRRLSEVDVAQGRANEAIDRAIDTIRAAQDAGAKLEEGILHRVAASALRGQADFDSATWFCERSRELLDKLGARFEVAKVDVEAGEIAAAKREPDDADTHFATAIGAFAEMGARWHLTRARNRRRALNPSEAKRAVAVGGGHGEVLLEVLQAAGRLGLDELLLVVLDKILEVTGFDRGFILLLDLDGRPSERMRRTRGEDTLGFGADDAVFSGSIVRRVAANGESVAVTDVADDIDLRDQESIVMLGLRQVMCVPMLSRGRVFGIVYVDSRRLPLQERDADLALLEALASQTSVAIENARLSDELRRKTELIGILAHEIRNPLSGILGFSSEEAIGDADVEDQRNLLGHIHRDAQRLRRLLDNVLELTRQETADVEWSMSPFEVKPLLEDIRDSFQASVNERNIRVMLDAEESCVAIGNADRIIQVVTNLMANAVKFTPDGSAITLSARSETVCAGEPEAPPVPPSDVQAWAPLGDASAAREYVRVDVTDQGVGMSNAARARMFEKFKQGDKQRSKGVGLGLFISREIIDRHGGTIWVDSEPGQGATFSFRIPSAV